MTKPIPANLIRAGSVLLARFKIIGLCVIGLSIYPLNKFLRDFCEKATCNKGCMMNANVLLAKMAKKYP